MTSQSEKGLLFTRIGVAGLIASFVWWAAAFSGSANFISCMWFWGVSCEFARGVIFLGGGGNITYSPLLFWASAACLSYGIIKYNSASSASKSPTQPSELASKQQEQFARRSQIAPISLEGIIATIEAQLEDEGAEAFTNAKTQVSGPAFEVLQYAKRDGITIEISNPSAIVARRGDQEETFVSNAEIITFGRRMGWVKDAFSW